MKIDFNEKYNTIAAYVLIVVIFAGLCVWAAVNIGGIFSGLGWIITILKPLIYGFIMAFLFYPLQKFFDTRVFAFMDTIRPRKKNKLKLPPKLDVIRRYTAGNSRKPKPSGRRSKRAVLSLVATYAVVLSIVGLCVAGIIPQVARSYTDLSSSISGYVTAAQEFIDDLTKKLPVVNIMFRNPSAEVSDAPVIKSADGGLPDLVITTIYDAIGNDMYDLVRNIQKSSAHFGLSKTLGNMITNSYDIFTNISPYILSALTKIVTETKNILLGLIISMYYLAARRRITERIVDIMYTLLPEKAGDRIISLASLINRCFIQFINGKLIDAVIIGALCFVLMTVFRMPYAPLISVLVGVTNVIPYLGPFLGAIPGAFIIFVSDPYKVIWFIVLIIALQQLDSYVIEPYALHSQTSLSAVWIMLSVIIMGGLFGVLGMFIGVPIFAVLYTLAKDFVERRLAAKGLPVETEAWM